MFCFLDSSQQSSVDQIDKEKLYDKIYALTRDVMFSWALSHTHLRTKFFLENFHKYEKEVNEALVEYSASLVLQAAA